MVGNKLGKFTTHRKVFDEEAIILSGQTESGIINTLGLTLKGIIVPAGFTGTNLAFQASDTAGGTFEPVHDDSGVIALTVAVDTVRLFSTDLLATLQFIKLVSDSQGSDSTIRLLFG